MKIRILMFTVCFSTMASAVFAQVTGGKTTLGLRAGVNFQNLNGKLANGDKTDNKLKTGFNVGLNAEIPVAPDYFVQPGLLFSTKGAKSNSGDVKYNVNYVEVPVNFIYKPLLGNGHMLLGFGPYIAFGVGGKVKAGSNEADVKFQNTVATGDPVNAYYFKRIDAGANFLAGYELSSKISVQLNAQLGMLKANAKDTRYFSDDKTAIKNTGFGISAGYRF